MAIAHVGLADWYLEPSREILNSRASAIHEPRDSGGDTDWLYYDSTVVVLRRKCDGR